MADVEDTIGWVSVELTTEGTKEGRELGLPGG